MAERDIKTRIIERLGFFPVVITSSFPSGQPGPIIDMQGFESIVFAMAVGAIIGGAGDVQLRIEHGDLSNLADSVPVPDEFLSGTEADTLIDTLGNTSSIGYIGKKQFVRAFVIPANIVTSLAVAVVAILGDGLTQPPEE